MAAVSLSKNDKNDLKNELKTSLKSRPENQLQTAPNYPKLGGIYADGEALIFKILIGKQLISGTFELYPLRRVPL